MNTVIINADQGKHTISRHIYGHFSEHLGRCIYDGYWVGEKSSVPNVRGIRTDIVTALKKINIPNLRWPGGCFADEYHWMDGIGPREQRPCMVNTHWGGVTENNHFGTHEFMDLCDQLECEPYICGNVGSGTVREMQQWIEYLTIDGISPMADLRKKNGREKPWSVKFWGVGNENWGCGGSMRPEYYADEYRRYATYCRNFGENKLFKIACGPHNEYYDWTEILMERCGRMMDGLALHYYTVPGPWNSKTSATAFTEKEWFITMQKALRMDELIRKHATIMDKHDPDKKVALVVDEWGTWFDVEPGTNPGFLFQQNSMRDALVAGVTLNIFNRHCERVKIANIAQTINVLQSMILTEGAKMILTPSYHVFDMYKVHQDATCLPVDTDVELYEFDGEHVPEVSVSASRDVRGCVNISLCNLNHEKSTVIVCEIRGAVCREVKGTVLRADQIQAHNTFDQPDTVKPETFTDFTLEGQRLEVNMPAAAVVVLSVQ